MEEYNYDAEAAVLGCLFINAKAIKKARAILNAEDFYEDRHKWIFAACEDLDSSGIPIDLITVHDLITKKGLNDQIGGASYITELTNMVPTAVHIEYYSKIVSDYSTKRKIKQVAANIDEAQRTGSTLQETLELVQKEIHDVNKLGGKQNKYQVSSMLDYVEEAEENYKNRDKMQGLSTGFPSIDNLTMGLVGGELIIIAGETSRGKTLLAMHIVNNIAKIGNRVLFVTLEMTKAQLTSRYMYANGGPHTSDFATVAANTIFQENFRLGWRDIDGLIQNAKEQLDVDIVVIDHLHYFARNLKNPSEELGEITMTFADNAKKYDIPIILISHTRRLGDGEQLSGNSLRGSSLIAQDSDIVLMVNRDPETNQMGILIDKNRNRGKLSDRTKIWGDRSEREINTIYLDFNNTKLHDPLSVPRAMQEVFPGSITVPYKD